MTSSKHTQIIYKKYSEFEKLEELIGNSLLAKRLLELGITSEALLQEEYESLIEVGMCYKRKVTQKDADLYSDITNFLDLDRGGKGHGHYGFEDFGDL